MAYEFIGNTEQYGSANENHAFAVKVDPTGTPVFSILDETIADVSGDFTLDLGTWDGRIIVVVVDDDDAIKLNAKANDWVLGKDTILGTTELDFLGSGTNKTMISASSEYPGTLAEDAFDGVMTPSDATDSWFSSAGNGPNLDGSCYLQWDFAGTKTISRISMAKIDDDYGLGQDSPKDIKVLSSATGLFSGEEFDHGIYQFNDPGPGNWSDYIVLASWQNARYLRIEIHSAYIDSGGIVSTKEIKFKELL